MEKRKIVIHTLESDLENAKPKVNKEISVTESAINIGTPSTKSLIRIKQKDYSSIYFAFVALGFFMIIGLLGYFLYLDHKENIVNISVAVEQEPIKAIDIVTLWPEITENDGIRETIIGENYFIIKVNNFDTAFKLYTNNQEKIKSFAEKSFELSNLKEGENIEINNIQLKTFTNTTNTIVYGFYFEKAFIIAKDIESFKNALRDNSLNKL